MHIDIKRIGFHKLEIPSRGSEHAAGYDLRCSMFMGEQEPPPTITIATGDTMVIDTGFAWEIPNGFVGMVCSRSGLAAKHGVFVANAPGQIDPDFRDQVKVILFNSSRHPFQIRHGDRIAQMVIVPISNPELVEVVHISNTKRGTGGLGSTGIG